MSGEMLGRLRAVVAERVAWPPLCGGIEADAWRYRDDWHRHIPDPVLDLWPDLSPDAKLVAYLLAERAAATLPDRD